MLHQGKWDVDSVEFPLLAVSITMSFITFETARMEEVLVPISWLATDFCGAADRR